MQQPLYLRTAATALARIAVLVALALTIACGHSAQSVTPSALSADPSTYDGQDVTVSGTVKNPGTRQMRRGTATTYQLCDSACINVVQFVGASVADGSKLTVTGRFRATFGRETAITNVLIVGGRREPQSTP
jgi:cytochrome c-type biogenesis protein CcmE